MTTNISPTQLRQERRDKAYRFVKHLEVARRNPGTRATLARSMGREHTDMIDLVPLVAPFASDGPSRPRYYAVATYVGAFGSGRPSTSLGEAVHDASRRHGANGAALMKSLTSLADVAESELLADRLPQLLRRLETLGVIPDMASLLDDLRRWDYRATDAVFTWTERAVLGPRNQQNSTTPNTNPTTEEKA